VVHAIIITLKCCPSLNYPSSHTLCPSYRTPDPCNSLVATVYRRTSNIRCITVSLELTTRRPRQFSRDVPADAGFLWEKAEVIGHRIYKLRDNKILPKHQR
jgi:hypothetical protein